MQEKTIEAYSLALAAFQKGDLEKAIKFWRKVVNNKAINEKVRGKAYLGIGFAYSKANKFKEALESYKSALTTFQKANDKKAQAECLGVIGDLYFRNNLVKEAIMAYQTALSLAKEMRNRGLEADLLGNIGSVFDFIDKYDEAIDFFSRSLKLYRKITTYKSNRGEARALYDLGLAYYHAKKLGEARVHLEKALRMMKKSNDKKGDANCHAALGDIYFEQGEFDNAEKSYNRAIVFYRANKMGYGILNILLGLAKITYERADFVGAKDKFENTLELASKIDYLKVQAASHLYLSKIYIKLGNPKLAENHEAKAQKIFKDLGIDIKKET